MTKRIAIAELGGVALDWAVADAVEGPAEIHEGKAGWSYIRVSDHGVCHKFEPYSPSAEWSDCGPLIERYRMDFREVGGRIHASPGFSSGFWGGDPIAGGTHLIAACRAIVAAHNPSGFVEVPDELVETS